MHCKSCHYPLKQLSEPRCPECGLAFDPNDPNTYFVSRNWQWLWWLWLAVLVGIVFVAFVTVELSSYPPWTVVIKNASGRTVQVFPAPMPSVFLRALLVAFVQWLIFIVGALLLLPALRRTFQSGPQRPPRPPR
jgi:hypothetical protein